MRVKENPLLFDKPAMVYAMQNKKPADSPKGDSASLLVV
jgi:hypothetical protein